MNKPYYSLLLW